MRERIPDIAIDYEVWSYDGRVYGAVAIYSEPKTGEIHRFSGDTATEAVGMAKLDILKRYNLRFSKAVA